MTHAIKTRMTSAALAALIALPGAAFAQGAAAPKTEETVQAADPNEITFEEVEMGDSNFKLAVEAMGDIKGGTDALSGLTSVSKVNIVPVEELVNPDANADTLAGLTDAHKSDIDALRAAISGNSALKALMNDHQVDVNSVLAIDVQDDGSVTLYVQRAS